MLIGICSKWMTHIVSDYSVKHVDDDDHDDSSEEVGHPQSHVGSGWLIEYEREQIHWWDHCPAKIRWIFLIIHPLLDSLLFAKFNYA